MGKAFTRPELDQKRGRRIGILPIAKIKTHYAFRSITTNLQPRIFLKEIHADEKSVITDLATNQSLTIHGTGENAYIASSEVHQPELGAVGIRISTH